MRKQPILLSIVSHRHISVKNLCFKEDDKHIGRLQMSEGHEWNHKVVRQPKIYPQRTENTFKNFEKHWMNLSEILSRKFQFSKQIKPEKGSLSLEKVEIKKLGIIYNSYL